MKLTRLLYKHKISVFGLFLFITISVVKIFYEFFKWTIIKMINLIKWFVRYIQFVKSGYSYKEVYDIIMSLNGIEFERFCFELLKASGLCCKLTSPTNDYGRDIIISTPEGRIFIECKHYTGENYVGRPICEKLLGSMQMLGAYKGIIITTGKIHSNAWECASMVDNLELWDMTDIMKLIVKIDHKKLPQIMIKSLGADTKIVKLNPVSN